MADAFENVSITFEIQADSLRSYLWDDEYDEYGGIPGEDIPVVCEWNKGRWEQIPLLFELLGTGVYNFNNITVLFHVTSGSSFSDVSVVFSIVRKAQAFASYIMQKPYLVISEINGLSNLEITDWNVSPNKKWFLFVNGLSVTLYNTQVDMLTEINPIATGNADPDTLEVVLTYESSGIMPFYYQDVSIHLVLSAEIAVDHLFCIKPFTDLTEIRHPIYNNSNIVLSRGESELNVHTHTVMGRELVLGVHVPEMEVGEIVDFTSVRRQVIEKSQILSQTIGGEMSDDGIASLINTIKVANYVELFR